MNIQIADLQMKIRRQKKGEQLLPFKGREINGTVRKFSLEDEADAQLLFSEGGNTRTMRITLHLKTEFFRENDCLEAERPAEVALTFSEKPEQITALYLHRDWWTRPAFVRKLSEVPQRTQCLLLKFRDCFVCMVFAAEKRFKTMASGGFLMREPALSLTLTAGRAGVSCLDELSFVMAESGNLYDAVEACMKKLQEETAVPGRKQRHYPEMFEYLGWCSWNAFYTEISEEKIREKARELKRKNVPVRWLLLDDGWLSVRENRLYALEPEKSKFPEGFLKLTTELKAGGQIRQIGVWHALGGYWGGIEPGSTIDCSLRDYLYKTAAGKLLPYPEAERGYGFYRVWYELLRREGIDFVKIDGQSAVKNYFENECFLCEATRGLHEAAEGAAGAYMNGGIINCMGMAMENMLGRPASALSRSSDDFVPENPDGFAEHLLQNAWNAIYTDAFYYGDWDMFWTTHPDTKRHALLRAVSGGPVYISDRIGETDPGILLPLSLSNGRILRMRRAAKPSPDCVFEDPAKTGLIKLTNLADCGIEGQAAGVEVIFNLSEKKISVRAGTADIYDLPAGVYCCYNYFSGQVMMPTEESSWDVTLPAGGFALFLYVPYAGDVAVLGLTDKYASTAALLDVCRTPEGFRTVVAQSGRFCFYTEKKVAECRANGRDVTDRLFAANGLYCFETKEEGLLTVAAVLKEKGESDV